MPLTLGEEMMSQSLCFFVDDDPQVMQRQSSDRSSSPKETWRRVLGDLLHVKKICVANICEP